MRISKAAWLAAIFVVGLFLFVTEVILVLGVTLGVFYEGLGITGLDGWLAPVMTVLCAGFAVWLLAMAFMLLGRIAAIAR